MNRLSEQAPVGILLVETDGTVRECNEAAGTLLDIDPTAAAGESIDVVFPDSVEASVPRVFDTRPEIHQEIEEYYPGPDSWFTITVEPGEDAVALYIEDVTDRHQARQRTQTLRDDLDRVTILNELISDILTDLVGAAGHEEIAETICHRLGETDIYEFAWVGQRELGSDELAVRAAAGQTGRTLDQIEAVLADGSIPECKAMETGDSIVVQPIGESDRVPEQIRRTAFADGLQSLLAIPLSYGSTIHGVVGVYSAELDAFSERERASFETVGEMAGFAVNATRHRNLLLSDTTVELQFQIEDTDAPLVTAANEIDGALSINGTVSQGNELLCYVEINGLAADATSGDDGAHDQLISVTETLEQCTGASETRVISSYDKGGTVEVELDEQTPLGVLVSNGANIQSATYDGTDNHVSVELSPDEDVRRVVETLNRAYEVEMLTKRERERDITTAREFRDELSEKLTEKQENALRTAFLADYFESPRESSSKEVAQALDITGPTLLHHLRAGQKKLLAELFDNTEPHQD